MDNNLKSKVTSQPLSKRMKELGWKQGKSYFIWLHYTKDTYKYGWKITDKDFGCHQENDEWCDAPLFCGVWDELPGKIEYRGKDKHRSLEKEPYMKYVDNDNYIDYESIMYDCLRCDTINEINEKPIQENAGELWCWLKENGYIEKK